MLGRWLNLKRRARAIRQATIIVDFFSAAESTHVVARAARKLRFKGTRCSCPDGIAVPKVLHTAQHLTVLLVVSLVDPYTSCSLATMVAALPPCGQGKASLPGAYGVYPVLGCTAREPVSGVFQVPLPSVCLPVGVMMMTVAASVTCIHPNECTACAVGYTDS